MSYIFTSEQQGLRTSKLVRSTKTRISYKRSDPKVKVQGHVTPLTGVDRVDNLPTNFGLPRTFRLIGQHLSDASRDLATLTFDLEGHCACRWCGSSFSICTPCVKFVGLPVRKILDIYCVCINRPGDLKLWPLTMAQILAVGANKHHRRIARIVSCRCVHFHQNWRPKIFQWILEPRHGHQAD